MKKRKIPFSPPDITEMEIQAVEEVLRSGWITTGPKTKLFEKNIAEYCGVEKAVCLNSATSCLESILRVLGIGNADEVITSAYTYTASASPACHLGAVLKMVDVGENSFEMDYDRLEAAITEKTKVIIPVDLGGVMCDYERIFDIVERKKALFHPENELQEAMGRIAVVADSAHGFGAEQKGKKSGAVADFTSFSFHAVKNLTTAEGGALTWKQISGVDDEKLYREFMLLSLHGQSKDALHKNQLGAWEYDILSPAYKCNMTDITAAIGIAQLQRYPELLRKRAEIINDYDSLCRQLHVEHLVHGTKESSSSGHLYLTRIPGITEFDRNEIIMKLAQEGVTANVHYKPLPMMTAYRRLGFDIQDYPHAYHQYENEITLPLHTRLTGEDAAYVMECFQKILKQTGHLAA